MRRQDSSRWVSGATAVAVCVDLCGSMPINIVIAVGGPFCPVPST
jgi:hypothetical protein